MRYSDIDLQIEDVMWFDIHALLIDGLINHDREKCISYFEKHYGFVEQSIG